MPGQGVCPPDMLRLAKEEFANLEALGITIVPTDHGPLHCLWCPRAQAGGLVVLSTAYGAQGLRLEAQGGLKWARWAVARRPHEHRGPC